MASVSLKNIYKVYTGGVTAVSDFCLDIEDKEFIVLVGPSGCGKSTTLRMVAGLEEISDGELYIGDKLVNDVAPKDRDIAMVFQNYALYPHMTVYDNMAFGLKLRKTPKAQIDKRVKEAARILGVSRIEFWDYQDYPLSMTDERIERLACKIREIRPDFILTHDKEPDPYNMDHNLASDALRTAYTIASGAGAVCNGLPVAPRQTPMFGFEPHMTEISSFTPGIYIDITDVFEQKKQAMACCATQANMAAHYIRKAEIRASECANRGGVAGCRYAEAFSTWGAVCMHGHFVW